MAAAISGAPDVGAGIRITHRIRLPFHGFALKFSPYNPVQPLCQLAVASSQYYGLAGNGKLQVFALHPSGAAVELASFDTPQGLFDVAWSECNPHHLLSGSADGSVCVWDTRASDFKPLAKVFNHSQEVSTVGWDFHSKLQFASASWDGTIQIFDSSTLARVLVLGNYPCHVYDMEWHPARPGLMLVAAGRHAALWDAKACKEVVKFTASSHDVLSGAWHKYQHNLAVTTGADGVLRFWDVRHLAYPCKITSAHALPVRKEPPAPCSHVCSDTTLKFWCGEPTERPGGDLLATCGVHTEFVCGLDWDLSLVGRFGSCGWDKTALVGIS